MKKLFVISLTLAFLISCGKSSAPSLTSESSSEDITIYSLTSAEGEQKYHSENTFERTYMYDSSYSGNFKFVFDADYFNSGHTSINFYSNLAQFLLGVTWFSGTATSLSNFLKSFNFDDVYFSNDYFLENREDTTKYSISRIHLDPKENVEEQDIVICCYGNSYLKEWENNVRFGLSEDHEGFHENAEEIYEVLYQYLMNLKKNNSKKVKLVFTGFSRGASITNLVSLKLHKNLDNSPFNNLLSHEYIYTYGFNSSLSLGEKDETYSRYFHQFVSPSDLIANMIPDTYGMYRIGESIDTYRDDYLELMQEVFPDFYVDEFKTKTVQIDFSGISLVDSIVKLTPEEAVQKVKQVVTTKATDDRTISVETREKYVENFQSELIYVLDLFLSTAKSKIETVVKELSKYYLSIYLSVVNVSPDSAIANIEKCLDAAGISYDKADLELHVRKLLLLGSNFMNNSNIGTSLLFRVGGTMYYNYKFYEMFHSYSYDYQVLKHFEEN